MFDEARGADGHWSRAGVAAALLLVGSALPVSGRLNPDFGAFGPDKVLHLLGHAGLASALLAAAGDGERSTRAGAGAVVASTAYGVTTELMQEAVPGREFEAGDVVAGLVGSVLGVAGWRRLAARHPR